MTKTIQMPASLSDKELGEQIELQADQYISQPLEEVALITRFSASQRPTRI